MQQERLIHHYAEGDLVMFEMEDERGTRFVVLDNQHYQVRILPDLNTGFLFVSIDAEWSDDKPGELANYTPETERSNDLCEPGKGEVTISDDGLLAVMVPQDAASHVDIRVGWTAQLPVSFVEPVRQAIALAEGLIARQEGGR